MGCEAGGGDTQQSPQPPSFPLPGGLQSRLRGAVRSHPLPQPSPKHEVESNYRGLKRGGRKKKKYLKGSQKAAERRERRTCHQSYQL